MFEAEEKSACVLDVLYEITGQADALSSNDAQKLTALTRARS